MVNIILAGASGRMGRSVLSVLPSFKGISLVGAVETGGHPHIGKEIYKGVVLSGGLSSLIDKCDAVIDFTAPEASVANLKIASSKGKPVVLCTTGHDSGQKDEIISMSGIVPVVFSPNMSVGVNVMWRLIEEASKVLGRDYQIDVVEKHHIHKKDAPSGTAKRMLEIIAGAGTYDLKKDVFYYLEGEEISESDASRMSQRPIKVKSVREGEIVGDHTILFTSPYERLEITHRAFSRDVFAAGALRAAMWVTGQPAGLYNMEDVLSLRGA